MPWTLETLMSEATVISGTSPEVAVSRVSHLVNQAQRDVASRLPHVEFEVVASSSMSSGNDKMYLPEDCETALALSYDTGASGVGGRVIRQAAPWEFDAKSDGTASGVPTMYLSYATWLEFYPSPDSGYSCLLRYRKRASDITSLTAIPSVDTRYHQAVLLKTVEYLHLRKGEYDKVAAARALYEQELRQVPNLYAIRQQNRSGMGLRYQSEED
jgi:hypothetical protein